MSHDTSSELASNVRPTKGEAPGGDGVLARYEAMVRAGKMERDTAQVAVASALDDVLHDLEAREANGLAPFLRRRLGRAKHVRGLYVWGSVGRGKTMLMDLFHELVPTDRKHRTHFNDFMADAHASIARLRKRDVEDAVEAAADEIAEHARVLSFDEFAVTDIADAMILSRLFERLFERGVTLVATSNVAPGELYSGGLNRTLFLPFIRLLRAHVDIIQLDADVDYRLDRLEDRRVWFPVDDAGFERLWEASLGDREAVPVAVKVGSRELTAPRSAGGLTRYTFAELCRSARGTNDYLALANRFHTLFLEGVPVMGPDDRETLRRFINLIDILYDHHARIVMSAEAEPRHLFDPRDGGARQEAFAFQRTASRLYEMRSASYLNGVENTPLT